MFDGWPCWLQLNDARKYQLLTQPWTPDPSFDFPRSGPKNLQFKYQWLQRWKWLAYSPSNDGVLCKYCCLFAGAGAGKGSQDLGILVKRPFSNWNKAAETFNSHENHGYHRRCREAADFFRGTMEKEVQPVDLQVDTAASRLIEENRSALRPIISTVLFCGRQGLALRGDNDSGPVSLTEPSTNDGNFRALLRFRVQSGDETLRKHLEGAARNATYVSSIIQNEIITMCNKIMLKKIVDRVNKAQCFSVLADETTDVSTQQQMSLIARYIDSMSGEVREDFLQFEAVTNAKGAALADTIISSLEKYGVKTEYMRGQGYDGAAAMSGEFEGTQAHIRENFPLAHYVHCASHVFNLAVCDACDITHVRNTIGTAKTIYSFFNTPKRQQALHSVFKERFPEKKEKRLKQLCATRWVEKHEAMITLHEIISPVCAALEDIGKWSDRDASSSATSLLAAIRTTTFLVTLVVLAKVMGSSLVLSRDLQSTQLDLPTAITDATNLRSTLQEWRANAQEEFPQIFAEVEEIAADIGAAVEMPRTTRRQTLRDNVPADTKEEYFRRVVYVPFLDNFLTQLEVRFTIERAYEMTIPLETGKH